MNLGAGGAVRGAGSGVRAVGCSGGSVCFAFTIVVALVRISTSAAVKSTVSDFAGFVSES